MTNKELIERVRGFEADHTPDGWPAIRMREISALANALEEAERKLAIAREACKDIRRAIERECYAAAYIIVSEALAQIGGEDAR